MAVALTMTNCPSEETLAAFLDGQLDAEERTRVIEHVAECGDCREIILAAREVEEGVEAERSNRAGESPLRFIPRRAVSTLVLVAATLAAGLFLTPIGRSLTGRETDLEKLVDLGNRLPNRTTEARFSGGFEYLRAKRNHRGPADSGSFTADQIANLGSELESRSLTRPTDRTLRALATSQLLRADWDQAVKTLERVLTRATKQQNVREAIAVSRDADLLTDLAAAYGARARHLMIDADYPMALAAADRAWKLDQTQETAWNRALVLEYLGQREDALNAWRAYLQIDSDSEWAQEARDRVSRLESPQVQQLWRTQERLLAQALSERNEAEPYRKHP